MNLHCISINAAQQRHLLGNARARKQYPKAKIFICQNFINMCDYFYVAHIVWKSPKMSHLNFGIFRHFLSY